MRLYNYVLISLFLLVSFCSNSQVLYEVTKYRSDKTSYLVGSHHYLSVSSLINSNDVFKAFNDCEVVLGEILIDEDSIQAYSKYLFSEKSIFSVCTENECYVIDSVCKNTLNIDLKQLQYLKPAMIENMLVQAILDKYYPEEEDSMMDSFFQKVAIQKSMDVFGLESIEDQMRLLFDMKSVETQAKELYVTALSLNDLSEEILYIDSLYSKGDLMPVYTEFQNDTILKEGDKFLLLDARNLNWINKIDQCLSKYNCFVVVGALHLYGENGLINLLKKRGYKVKQIN